MRKQRNSKILALGIVAVAFALALAAWLLTRTMALAECHWYGYQTDREVRYAAFVGCMAQINGKWYPRNELRIAQ